MYPLLDVPTHECLQDDTLKKIFFMSWHIRVMCRHMLLIFKDCSFYFSCVNTWLDIGWHMTDSLSSINYYCYHFPERCVIIIKMGRMWNYVFASSIKKWSKLSKSYLSRLDFDDGTLVLLIITCKYVTFDDNL